MTVTLQIDDVPEQVFIDLSERAQARDQTLQELLLDLITRESTLHRIPLTRTQAHSIVSAPEAV